MTELQVIEKTDALAVFELSDQDAARAAEIIAEGTSENTARARRSDLRYFSAWAEVTFGRRLPFPVPVSAVVKFVIDHLDGLEAGIDRELVRRGVKAQRGAHKLSTVERRLANLSKAHEAHFERLLDSGISDEQKAELVNPVKAFAVRELLRAARRRAAANGGKPRKVEPLLAEDVERIMDGCSDGLRGLRDAAILAVAFASGGRRRSELCALQVEDLSPVTFPDGSPGYTFTLARSKTDQAGERETPLPVAGRAYEALREWLEASGIKSGPVFRGVDRYGRLRPVLRSGRGVNGQTVANIVKARAQAVGIDPARVSGHSLRRGFMTQGSRAGIAKHDLCALSGHSPAGAVAEGYVQARAVLENPAGRLLG